MSFQANVTGEANAPLGDAARHRRRRSYCKTGYKVSKGLTDHAGARAPKNHALDRHRHPCARESLAGCPSCLTTFSSATTLTIAKRSKKFAKSFTSAPSAVSLIVGIYQIVSRGPHPVTQAPRQRPLVLSLDGGTIRSGKTHNPLFSKKYGPA